MYFVFYDRLIIYMMLKDDDIFYENIYKDNLDNIIVLVILIVVLCVIILIIMIICYVWKWRYRGSIEGGNNF